MNKTETIVMTNDTGEKATIADSKGDTQTVATAGWQDTKEEQERRGNGK